MAGKRKSVCVRAGVWRGGVSKGATDEPPVSHSRALAAAAVGVCLCEYCECSCRAFSSHHVRVFPLAVVPTGLRSS